MAKDSGKNGYARFEDLGEVTQEVNLRRPDGRELKLKLRTLREQEMRTIRRQIAYPAEPMEPQRDPADGKVKILPVKFGALRDRYSQDLEEAQMEYNYRLLLASVVDLDVPGETEADKVTSLRGKLGFWALRQLVDIMLGINGIRPEEVEQLAANFPVAT